MRAFQERHSFAKLIDFHSYARQVRINYGPCAPLPGAMSELFAVHGKAVANTMKYEQSQSCCMGGDIHYAFNRHGTLAFLIETGDSGFQPDPTYMQAEVRRVYPGILTMLKRPIAIHGVVKDAATN